MSAPEGKEVVCNDWLLAGISNAINLRSNKLPSLDPFKETINQGGIDNFTVQLRDIDLAVVNSQSCS